MNELKKDRANPQILLIEDSTSHAMIYMKYLTKAGYNAKHIDNGGAGLVHIKENPPEVLLLDLELPDIPGMSILKYINDNSLPSSVIIITGHGSINIAVEAMQSGAFDFLTKPFNADRLNDTVKNALAHQSLSQQVCQEKDKRKRQQYNGFIGASESMQTVYQMIDNVALSKASVFICGESGTGKELCAQAVHERSPRKSAPFVALNCASIPKELMESEFFGHIKGAFTGAHTERKGAVELADGGTLFLDEICEMDLNLQSKLLRFIQTGIYRKVGSDKERKVDIRFVCATNRSPLEEVTKGNFREDLYYRLHVIPINLPPLRERDKDPALIAKVLLKNYAAEESKNIEGFTPEAEDILNAYQWPGNVRQMQNIIRMIAVLNSSTHIAPEQLPPPLNTVQISSVTKQTPPLAKTDTVAQSLPVNEQQAAANRASPIESQTNNTHAHNNEDTPEQVHSNSEEQGDTLDLSSIEKIEPFGVYERKIIEAAISKCEGNVPEAAAQLALSPSTLYRKIQGWRTEKR